MRNWLRGGRNVLLGWSQAMKKATISFLVIAAAAAGYVLAQSSGPGPLASLPAVPQLPKPAGTGSSPPAAPQLLAKANPAPVRHGALANGTYTGPAINVLYGLVQIQAVVQNGRLISINVLRYPSDRRTSVRINNVALPMLRHEVVTAQSANVNIISGATLTSVGFIRSLYAALQQAKA
jgi:uncharacterized protein with FMN-binding domain